MGDKVECILYILRILDNVVLGWDGPSTSFDRILLYLITAIFGIPRTGELKRVDSRENA